MCTHSVTQVCPWSEVWQTGWPGASAVRPCTRSCCPPWGDAPLFWGLEGAVGALFCLGPLKLPHSRLTRTLLPASLALAGPATCAQGPGIAAALGVGEGVSCSESRPCERGADWPPRAPWPLLSRWPGEVSEAALTRSFLCQMWSLPSIRPPSRACRTRDGAGGSG